MATIRHQVDEKIIDEINKILREMQEGYIGIDYDDHVVYKKSECECGGEKTNTTHSDWCPKYKVE